MIESTCAIPISFPSARRRAPAVRPFGWRWQERRDLLRAILSDPGGRKIVRKLMPHGLAARPCLIEVARLILARKLVIANGGAAEPVVLAPRLTDGRIEFHAIAKSAAIDPALLLAARYNLDAARIRAECLLVLHPAVKPRPSVISGDRYPLPHLTAWLKSEPQIARELLFDILGGSCDAPAALPSSRTSYDDFVAAGLRHPDLLPLLHDIDRQRLGFGPAPPFDRARMAPPAEPQRRSVLFLHNCYYNFKYLAAALRDRGWDAVVATFDPPGEPNRNYFHGEDINLYDPDPVRFKKRLDEFFDEICGRFGIVHSYGVGALSLYPVNQDADETHTAVPWDLLEWRRRGILIGYTPTGCLDGVSQSAFRAWSPNSCARCVWRDRPDVCSDTKNRAWSRKREMLVDLIALDCGPAIDFNKSDKAFRGPLTSALDPDVWHPDLTPPEHLRRLRTRDDEILVYHGVGNYQARTRDGINIKGTHAVIAAIDTLRAEGIPIRLDFVDDVPSIDNRFVQVQADIIVDQLNHGRYGATAREGMMLGKPVVGWINPWDGDGNPATRCILETPVVSADEATIKDVLRDLALNPAKRAATGRASRAHAIKWCSAPSLAERFERVYDIVRELGRPPRELD